MIKTSIRAALLLGSIVTLSGCVVAEQPGRPVVVAPHYGYHYNDRDRDHYDYDRDHCPPGHRKKHWC